MPTPPQVPEKNADGTPLSSQNQMMYDQQQMIYQQMMLHQQMYQQYQAMLA